MRKGVRVVISDEARLFRACLRRVLEVPAHVIRTVYGADVGNGFEVIGEAGTGEELVRLAQSLEPDVILVNPSLPRMSGLEALRELHAGSHKPRTVLLGESIERVELLSAIQLGVRGFVLKDSTTATLFEAIACVLANQYWLGRESMTDFFEWVSAIPRHEEPKGAPTSKFTQRQREVLIMVAAGSPNKDIALRFNVSEETVKHHLTRIFEKVGVSSRLELAIVATQRGLDRLSSAKGNPPWPRSGSRPDPWSKETPVSCPPAIE